MVKELFANVLLLAGDVVPTRTSSEKSISYKKISHLGSNFLY